jgi:hypothetical protein
MVNGAIVSTLAALLGGTLAQAPVPDSRNPVTEAVQSDRVAPPAPTDDRPIPPMPVEPTKVRTAVQVRNDMGANFRLVEARILVDGVQVARKVASKDDDELERTFTVLDGTLPEGQHALVAQLRFQGRNRGFIRYMDSYAFNTETVQQVTVKAGEPVALTVVATERAGATVPVERKPMLHVEAGGVATARPVSAPRPVNAQ